MNSGRSKTSPRHRKAKTIIGLPGLLREIADVTSVEVALLVAKAKGGQRAYFSIAPRANNWLVKIVGLELAIRIGKALFSAKGGTDLDIPMGPATLQERLCCVERMTLDGCGKMKIAKAVGVHHRTIQTYRRMLREAGRLPAHSIISRRPFAND